MSSPNIGSSDLSSLSSPITDSASSAAAKDYRKRQLPPSAPSYSPNETLNQMTQEAEARQQDKLNAQKEIRAIRAAEIERKRNEDEERERRGGAGGDRSFRSDSISTLNSSLTKPRQTSTRMDNFGDESNPNDPKELQKKIKEMDEKFKKHAMYQTQLENDNQKLIYEVELLKDMIEENEELITELRRQFKEKSRELDFERRAKKDLQTDFNRLKEILKQRDALIENSGLILYTDNEVKKKVQQANTSTTNSSTPVMMKDETPVKTPATNKNNVSPITALQANSANVTSLSNQLEELNNEIRSVLPAALVSPATAKLLDTLGEGTIDDKLRQLLSEKQELKETTARLLSEVEKERNRSSQLERRLLENTSKMIDSQDASHDLHELQRQYTKEINDLKMKLQKIEHENIIIKQDKQRLDTQLKYLQTNLEDLEQTERRLMKEKREAQRELNESKMQISDLTLKLEVYQKTLEKKRQPTAPKFLDATSYTSLTSQSLSSSSATPTSASTSSSTNPLLSHHLNNNAHLNSLSSSSSMSSIANSNDPQDVFIDSQQQHRKNSTTINLLEIKSNNNNSEINKTVNNSGHSVVSQHESSPPPTISSHEASSTSSSSSASPSNHHRNTNDDPPTTHPPSSSSKEIKIIRINGTKNENSTNGNNSLLMDAPSRHISNA